jgi:hypothetical protein
VVSFLVSLALVVGGITLLWIDDRRLSRQPMPGFRECSYCALPLPERDRICPHCKQGAWQVMT